MSMPFGVSSLEVLLPLCPESMGPIWAIIKSATRTLVIFYSLTGRNTESPVHMGLYRAEAIWSAAWTAQLGECDLWLRLVPQSN
jgi:hypothetical protein